MRKFICFAQLLLLLAAATGLVLAQAPTTSFKPTPANATIQALKWHQVPGCACGIYPDAVEVFRRGITFAPNPVVVNVNQPVEINFDASTICNGQSVQDTSGTIVGDARFKGVGNVIWEPGVVQTLPNSYGIVRLDQGFPEAKKYNVQFNISLYCFDTGANCKDNNNHRLCNASVTVPVTVK
jgi:hypothetical protein